MLRDLWQLYTLLSEIAMPEDSRQAGDLPINVTEIAFCDAVSAAVREYFREDNTHTGALFAGPPIALIAFDQLRGGRT